MSVVNMPERADKTLDVEIITMQQLLDKAMLAMSTMSSHNDHRTVMLNLVNALMSLTNRLDAAVQVLRVTEWIVDSDGTERCAWCGGTRAQGHKVDCERGPFLAALVAPQPEQLPQEPSRIIRLPGGES